MQIELTPNPRQVEFFTARERFIAYGGARGGGKSWAIRQKARLLALYYGGIRILILRRSYPELRENHILPMQSDLRGLATWREGEKTFVFPNSSRIRFGYCAGESDVEQYQGSEFDVIFMDEATHFTEYQFAAIGACLRGVNRFPKRMYLTCNPGGVGHAWVKRLFVDRDFRPGEDGADYRFIPARASDNTALLESDPGYLKMLDNLPDSLRSAWRDGSWEVFAGQYFTEFRPEKHVCAPRHLPAHWPRWRVFDYGLDMLACLWCAVDPGGRVWVYRELCRKGLIVSQAARAMLEHTLPGEYVPYTIAPPDMWGTQKDTGRSMGELFTMHGVPLVTASNRRVPGWLTVREYLKTGADGLPGLMIFDTCPTLIRDLGTVQHDGSNPSDVARQPHEYTHTVDALRYFCAWRRGQDDREDGGEDLEDGLVDHREFMLRG